jgi:hypothetical protein
LSRRWMVRRTRKPHRNDFETRASKWDGKYGLQPHHRKSKSHSSRCSAIAIVAPPDGHQSCRRPPRSLNSQSKIYQELHTPYTQTTPSNGPGTLPKPREKALKRKATPPDQRPAAEVELTVLFVTRVLPLAEKQTLAGRGVHD